MEEQPHIEIGSQEQVDRPELTPYIDRILRAIEHPEALITDETSLYDFGNFSDITERKLVQQLRHNIGITVDVHEPFWKIAAKLRDHEQG